MTLDSPAFAAAKIEALADYYGVRRADLNGGPYGGVRASAGNPDATSAANFKRFVGVAQAPRHWPLSRSTPIFSA